MSQRSFLSMTLCQLREAYKVQFPELYKLAVEVKDYQSFKTSSWEYIYNLYSDEGRGFEQISELYGSDGKTISELSNQCDIKINTIEYLYQFLHGSLNTDVKTDFFIDLYWQLNRLGKKRPDKPVKSVVENWMSKWPSGLDYSISKERTMNQNRLFHVLVDKLSDSAHQKSKYYLDNQLSYDEKLEKVRAWWNDYHYQLAMAARTPEEVKSYLGDAISSETYHLMKWAQAKDMPFFLTPYYASLLNTTHNGFDDSTIRSSVLYSPELVNHFGKIRSWEGEDIIKAGEPNNAGWLVPNDFNVHRRYPEVALLIPDTMGRACGGLCAYCQRMYDFQNKGLNFELENLVPKETWNSKLKKLMEYFENDSQIRDILLSGGDFLMSQNSSLRNILNEVLNMAERKRENNKSKKDGEKYAEIQRVRIGTRLPVYLPMRFDDELIEILTDFKKRGSALGIKQFVIQTHFQSPLEVTKDVKEAVDRILSTGWLITNQLVFNVAESRRGHTAKLRKVLTELGIACYYTFSVKGYEENHALFTPISRSVQEAEEEKFYGRLNPTDAQQLADDILASDNVGEPIKEALRKYDLPFLSSDRNVLNLPAIGKSISFRVIGIDKDGRRILRFDHDRSRRHSPIIDKLGEVYIIENKSLAEYLRQIYKMGEDIEDYSSIWNFTFGKTEPRFPLYKYPEFTYKKTDVITNLKI